MEDVPDEYGHPCYLFFMNDEWLLASQESYENRDGKAFLKLKTEGSKQKNFFTTLKKYKNSETDYTRLDSNWQSALKNDSFSLNTTVVIFDDENDYNNYKNDKN